MKKIWDNYSYAIILIAVSFIFTFVFAGEIFSADEEYIMVTVNEGESLWKIAEELSDEHDFSKREFIAWVEKENSISDGRIYAGEQLVVPIMPEAIDSNQVAGTIIE